VIGRGALTETVDPARVLMIVPLFLTPQQTVRWVRVGDHHLLEQTSLTLGAFGQAVKTAVQSLVGV
jgi:hypothetical protein